MVCQNDTPPDCGMVLVVLEEDMYEEHVLFSYDGAAGAGRSHSACRVLKVHVGLLNPLNGHENGHMVRFTSPSLCVCWMFGWLRPHGKSRSVTHQGGFPCEQSLQSNTHPWASR